MDSIKHFFTQLFTQLNSGDSWTVIGMLLSTFLIGLITNYFLNRSRVKQLEEALDTSAKEKAYIKTQLDALKEQYALQEADLTKANLELTDISNNLEKTEAEKRALNSRLNGTLLDLDKSREEFQETTSRVEDLNDQILGLRTKNVQLNTELEQNSTLDKQYALSQNTSGVSQEYEQRVANLAAENSLLKNSIEELRTEGIPDGTTSAALKITQLETENEELKNKANESGASTKDYEALEVKLAELEAEKIKLEESYAEIIQLEDGNDTLSTTLTALMEENEQLKEQLDELPQYEAGNDALNSSLHTLVSENEELKIHEETVIQYEAGNEILHATVADLIEKKEALEKELSDAKSNQIEWAVGNELGQEEEELEELGVEEAKVKFKAAIGNTITIATIEEQDDLKIIQGIGPFIEEKLNNLGIYTYEQVSQLDDNLMGTLTTAIEFFPGRIDRDDWVGQADRLYYTKGNAPQEMTNTSKITTRSYATYTEKINITEPAKEEITAVKVEPDNLKKIEGIGPKIAELLNKEGIYTFASLAATSTTQLSGILAAAGNRYKMHNPSTWPEQARLAAAGEWTKLKEWQDQLDGGRDVAKG